MLKKKKKERKKIVHQIHAFMLFAERQYAAQNSFKHSVLEWYARYKEGIDHLVYEILLSEC